MKYCILFAIAILAGSARPVLSHQSGAIREDPKDWLKYVWIPPGTFMMGCSPDDRECKQDEKPPHRVSLGKGFWVGRTIDDIAWYFTYGVAETHAVAQKRPNAFGLFDMLGNVWELVNDWYAPDYYPASTSQDPTGPASGKFRVLC